MTILQILPYSYPSGCGIWSRAFNDSIQLTQKGYTLHTFSSNLLKGTKAKLPSHEEYSSIRIHRFPILLKFGGSAMIFTFFREFFKVKPDIVIVHGYRHPASLLGLILSKISRKKVFMTTHAPFGKDPRRSVAMKFIDVAYDILIGWWELRLYNKIIMVAKWEEEVLRKRFKLGAKRLIYISNSIAEEFIDNSEKALQERLEQLEQEVEQISVDLELQANEKEVSRTDASIVAGYEVRTPPSREGRVGDASGASLENQEQKAEVIHLPPSKEDSELQTQSNSSDLYSSVANSAVANPAVAHSAVRSLPLRGGRRGDASGADSAVWNTPLSEVRIVDPSFGASLENQTKLKTIALNNNYYNKSLKNYARENRSKMTKGEVILWSRIKGKQLYNLRFLRQRPIDKFIVDFLQPELKLLIEIDGSSHDENKYQYDSERENTLKKLGFNIIRFTEHETVTRIDEVMQSLVNVIEELSKKAKQKAEVIHLPPSKEDSELQTQNNSSDLYSSVANSAVANFAVTNFEVDNSAIANPAVRSLPLRGGRRGDASGADLNFIHSAFFMGRIDPTKRPDWLINLAGSLPKYNFYIGGPINNYEIFESDLPNVQIENFVYEKKDFIQKAKENLIFIMPSVRETFGLTMVEAMSQACIVISSDTKGAREFIVDGYNGYIVNSQKEVEEKLLEIGKMPVTELISIITNSVETSRKYDSREIGKRLITLVG